MYVTAWPSLSPRSMFPPDRRTELPFPLNGQGTSFYTARNAIYHLLRALRFQEGDTILVPAGELHATRNIGNEPLVLLCFFPVGDISRGTEEPTPGAAYRVPSSAP